MTTLVAPPEDGADVAPSASTAPAPCLDASRLEVLHQVGQGGMATIHLAMLTQEGAEPRRVALKVMHSHLSAEPSLMRRFEHEVRAQFGLAHPNVVELAGWGRDASGRLFMAMEYVDGPVLKDLMAEGRRFPADVATHVLRSVLRGLQAAHARGIVHRDVKPANVMTTANGQVKVADFGISKAADMTKLTSTGNVIGTPAYMSPEQALGRPLDARSDLFSAGVMLYEMLVGGNPFQTGNPATTLSRVVHHQQRPAFEVLPQTPATLDDLLERLLQKDPAQRVPSAEEALRLLETCIEEEGLRASEATLVEFMREPDATTRRLNATQARRHFERGTRFYAAGRGSAEAAVWEFFLATLLDPGDAQARTWLEQVSRERGYSLERRPNARIDELEAQLGENPDSLPLVVQLAKLHKAQGNFLQVIYYYKRARALRPPDNYTRGQIETLVSAQAAGLLDGTHAFETRDHVPVRMRVPPPAAAPERAEGLVDFARGVLSTTWGRYGAVAAVLVGCVLGVGALFDSAANAASDRAVARPSDIEPEIDRQVMLLEAGRARAEAGEAAEAESIWRRFLAEFPTSGLRSEVLFRLGESLERQGRRAEALEAHQQNAADHLDEWALKSREHRGELLAVEGDAGAARREYEAVARNADGDLRLRAQLALAELASREGRTIVARREFEEVVAVASGALLIDARLAQAEFLARQGDVAGARQAFEVVRANADHHGDAFRRAEAGLASLNGAEAVAGADAPADTQPATPRGEREDAWGWQSSAPATAEPAETAPASAPEANGPPPTGLLSGLAPREGSATP